MSKVQIFKTLEEFDNFRILHNDYDINGVSQEFLDKKGLTLETLNLIDCTGCWNCYDCIKCTGCEGCINCILCRVCTNCRECIYCDGDFNLTGKVND